MNFYLDIEAVQPSNEIIAIGVVAETGDTFYSLVKPQLSQINNYVSQLTHITQNQLNEAPNIDCVMNQLDDWLYDYEPLAKNRYFYSYGSDIDFFRASLPTVNNNTAFITMSTIIIRLTDYSKKVFEFFHGTVKLVGAYNYINQSNYKQTHNALEDAKLLREVFHYVQSNEPLLANPFLANQISPNYNKPHGVFYARSGKHSKIEQRFNNIDEAVDWIISHQVNEAQRDSVHRERMMAKIMKAIRTNTKYSNYFWRRVKESENNDN